MKNKPGEITKEKDGFKVKFQRILPFSREIVWNALTDTEKLKIWFTDIEMDFVEGGDMRIYFRDEDKTASYGKILKIEKPRFFQFTWEDELATWELFDEPVNKCRLVFTYSKLADNYAISVPAGWHSLLNQLETVLNGRNEAYPFGGEETEETRKLKEHYTEVVHSLFPQLKELSHE